MRKLPLVALALTLAACGDDAPPRAAPTPTPTPTPVTVSIYLGRDEVGYRDRTLVAGRAEGVESGRATLEADRHPFDGTFRRLARSTVRDGGFRFRVRPTANTRYRARLSRGDAMSRVVPLFVYPDGDLELESLPGNGLQGRFTVRGPSDFRAGARPVFFYRRANDPGTYRRVASRRLRRTGPGRAEAIAPLPDRGTVRTAYIACVGARLAPGFGRPGRAAPDGGEPDGCGDRRLRNVDTG